MSDERALDRVRKLIQRTSSANRAEAEQSAYMACKLIRQIGLEIVDPSEVDEILREREELKQKVLQLQAGIEDDDYDSMTAAARVLGQQVAQAANQAFVGAGGGSGVASGGSGSVAPNSVGGGGGGGAAWAPRWSSPANPAWAGQGHSQPVQPQPAMKGPIALTSKFRGHCKYCSRTLNVGDPILWQKSVGSWCQTTDCYQNWVNLQNFNPTTP